MIELVALNLNLEHKFLAFLLNSISLHDRFHTVFFNNYNNKIRRNWDLFIYTIDKSTSGSSGSLWIHKWLQIVQVLYSSEVNLACSHFILGLLLLSFNNLVHPLQILQPSNLNVISYCCCRTAAMRRLVICFLASKINGKKTNSLGTSHDSST